jgi:hypothetical protein
MATDEYILQLAENNQRQARRVIAQSRVVEAWQSIGAEVNLIGSLKMGLLMTHRDIDFHIYTPRLKIGDSFRAVSLLAENPDILRVEFANLLEQEDQCLEWHAWYQDENGDSWQLDMMHIVRGSKYDGYFENMAEKIMAEMTPRQKEIILRLKFETPADLKIPGIEYYMAVLRGGVCNYGEFSSWRRNRLQQGIVEWK